MSSGASMRGRLTRDIKELGAEANPSGCGEWTFKRYRIGVGAKTVAPC